MLPTDRRHHWLLPGELRDDADGRRSARDWFVDLLMFLVAANAAGTTLLADDWDPRGQLIAALDILLGVACLAALWWRRSHPDAVGILGAASLLSELAVVAGLIAVFNVALRGSRRAIWAVVAISAAMVGIVDPILYPSDEGYVIGLVIGALLLAVVFGLGLLVRARREQVISLRNRAREAERRRIAHEMHDVLAHRVSLLSLHAGALEFRPDAPPEEIAEAAAVIRSNARATLEELREVIGVLRDGPDGGGPERPQPTLDDLPTLVEESRAAGMAVRCRIDVPAAHLLPRALSRTAYRVVQEGLTNARKHAPESAVEVAVSGGDKLAVEVVTRRPAGVAVAAESLLGASSGLIGLDERVSRAGGSLHAGPDAGGDFVLRATLPWRR